MFPALAGNICLIFLERRNVSIISDKVWSFFGPFRWRSSVLFQQTIPLRFKGCHLSLWNGLRRTKEEMEARYMVQESVEPEEVELPDPALSPTSKLIHNNKRTEIGTLSVLQQEIKRYELSVNPGRAADVLDFWRLFQGELPNLARIARIVLAIPASSSKSERVFSTGGLVVSSKRFNLFHFHFCSATTGAFQQFTTSKAIVFLFSPSPLLIFNASCFRGSLAPSKAEALMVLKENQDLVDDFKRNSLYKLKRTDHNAFAAVEMEAVEGEGEEEDEEGLQLYLEDLEADESAEEGEEEDAEEH